MEASNAIADLIDRVKLVAPLDADAVGRLFAAPLVAADDPGNPFLRIFTAAVPEPSPVQSLELRIPVDASDPARAKQALLILDVRPSKAVPMSALRGRLGPPVNIEPPRAASPFGTPTHEVFPLPGGRLSVGYLPADGNRVKRVIFDMK